MAPDVASLAGAPVGAGTFSLTAAPWGALAISVPHSQAIYLGAAPWRISSTSFAAQVRGGDWLMLQVPGTQLHDGTVFNFTASDPINIWGDALPLTAREVNCLMTMSPGSATSARIAFDDLGPNVTGTGTLGMSWAGDMPSPITHHFTALPNDDGEITFTAGAVQPTTTDLGGATLYSTGYRDVILGRR